MKVVKQAKSLEQNLNFRRLVEDNLGAMSKHGVIVLRLLWTRLRKSCWRSKVTREEKEAKEEREETDSKGTATIVENIVIA